MNNQKLSIKDLFKIAKGQKSGCCTKEESKDDCCNPKEKTGSCCDNNLDQQKCSK